MSHPWHLYHADTWSASSLPSNMPLSTIPNPQTGLSGSAMGYLLHWKNAEQWGHVIWNLCIHLCIANRPFQHYNQIRSEHYESQKDNQTGINYGTTLIHPTTNHLQQKPATTVFPQIEHLASEQSDLAHKNLSTSLKQTQGQPAFLSVGLFSFFFQNNEAPGLEHWGADKLHYQLCNSIFLLWLYNNHDGLYEAFHAEEVCTNQIFSGSSIRFGFIPTLMSKLQLIDQRYSFFMAYTDKFHN